MLTVIKEFAMYELMIKTSFASAHNLRDYEGACERLHGHNWRVDVFVKADSLDSIGLALDFKILKEKTRGIIDELDHKYLNEIEPFTEINPSSENMARYLFKRLSEGLIHYPVKVSKVTVWESENACASYYEE
ncbi:MAG: hypothetical protein HW382_331 [Deltaproteobacteria bacterium]|nr:hypothetical protein [Deltaproteobacteria bacterium]